MSTNSTTQALTQKIPTSIGTLWSGKRDSNSRPRPWQGRALPTELFPPAFSSRHSCSRLGIIKVNFASALAVPRIPPWSGKRDSNSRPRPWQGRALPTELFPLCLQIGNLITFAQGFRFANCGAKVQLFSIPQTFSRKNFPFFLFNTNYHEYITNLT